MKRIIIVTHITVILATYTSPFWLDYRLIIVGILAYYLQLLIFGGCVLSLKQFDGQKQTFHEWYLRKLGFSPNPAKLRFILDFVIPPCLLIAAVVIQR